MNKKYLITTSLALFIFTFSYVIGASGGSSGGGGENCRIKETPKYLIEFMKNVKKVANNVKGSGKGGGDFESEKDKDGYENSLFNWTNNEISFEYKTQEDTQEIPDQVKRDVDKLDQIEKGIKLLDSGKATAVVTYKDICSGVSEEYCNFEKSDKFYANKVLTLLKESILKVENLIQNKATIVDVRHPKYKIYLLPGDKIKELKRDYSKKSIKMCSIEKNKKGKKGFLGKVMDCFKKKDSREKQTMETKKDWKESYRKLLGNAEENKALDEERKKMKEKLEEKKLIKDTPTSIMCNTKKYNKNSNDKATCGGGYLNSLSEYVDSYFAGVKKLFPEADSQSSSFNFDITNKNLFSSIINKFFSGPIEVVYGADEHYEGNTKLLKARDQIIMEQATLLGVHSSYKALKDTSKKEDIQLDKFNGRLGNMHLNLNSSINMLNETCLDAQAVCNGQLTGKGNCGQCY